MSTDSTSNSDSPVRLSILACERCSRRKQRCDRQLPTCSQCVKAKVGCIRAQNEAEVVQTQQGIIQRKGPVKLLEDRLATLQALASERGKGVPLEGTIHNQQTPSIGVDKPSSDLLPSLSETLLQDPANLTTNRKRKRRPVPASELSLGLLCLGAMSEPTRRAGEVLPELSIPRIICVVTEVYGGDPEKTRRIGSLWDSIAKNIRKPDTGPDQRFIVPQAEAQQYLKAYFETVDVRYPRLSRADAECGINAISTCDQAGYDSMVESSPASVFIAYMIIAIVPLISESYPGAQASFISIHMLSQALKILDKVFRLEDGTDIIQCLRLLVVFSLHSSAAGSSWHLVSFAMKKCIALGFHRETPAKLSRLTSQQMARREQQRWAFWSCYLLDRLICTALDRPYSIGDMYITVRFPYEESLASPDHDLAVPQEIPEVHLLRYAVLMSEVAEDRGQRAFTYHLSHLLHWRASSPDSSDPKLRNQGEYLLSLYNTLLLRIIIDQIIIINTTNLGADDHFDDNDQATPSVISSLPTPRSHQSRRSRSYSETRSNETQMKLFATCQAVVESLTRPDMKHRSVLSWVTGYSAMAAGFGLCYWLVTSPTSFDNRNNSIISDQESTTTRNGSKTSASQCLDLLESVLSVLTTVGRQFSRMSNYHKLLVYLRDLILSLKVHGPHLRADQSPRTVSEAKDLIKDIGPNHLRNLAGEILRRAEMLIEVDNEV